MKNRIQIHDNWQTPKYILDQIREEFGEFFDPCPVNSDFDGLEIDWKDVNYINPPYSLKMKTAFVKKAIEESKKGKVCIMLIPVSTSTKLFHEDILTNADEIRFVKGRINFNGFDTQGSNGKKYQSGQMDSMIVVFSPSRFQTQANPTDLSPNKNFTETKKSPKSYATNKCACGNTKTAEATTCYECYKSGKGRKTS